VQDTSRQVSFESLEWIVTVGPEGEHGFVEARHKTVIEREPVGGGTVCKRKVERTVKLTRHYDATIGLGETWKARAFAQAILTACDLLDAAS